MKQRVFFVGVHNKPGMEPLDSRTKSGKVIDSIIANLPEFDCVKTNLFDKHFVPDDCKDPIHFEQWGQRVKYTFGDIIVLLGVIVRDCFGDIQLSIISVEHPASRHLNQDRYIDSVTLKIRKLRPQ